ncbi:hypothetical protein KQX54_014289 [Cotesia glomerata]|uniref:Uncharacterized protein n=1 Tax=Cotesia glomerata TaxID=32391 RepID=A0AAV7ISL4_COTGL|nr:hypothetical protein KQX54_014289 [Cotesia glomerata]
MTDHRRHLALWFSFQFQGLSRISFIILAKHYITSAILSEVVIPERMRTSLEFSLALTWRRVESPGIGRCLADNYSRDPPRQRWMSLLAFAGIYLYLG